MVAGEGDKNTFPPIYACCISLLTLNLVTVFPSTAKTMSPVSITENAGVPTMQRLTSNTWRSGRVIFHRIKDKR